ncbi:nuclease 1 [Phytophthora palmivora]|uniref:Nuclease 1 n=1 Tax=Phytophthora palmivora TaxID=4796 RepID=A0A2P4XU99_9STRA|nr:nuclease 1 [Phytophthora palmivora]
MASWAALNVTGGDTRANLSQERATEEAQDADNAATYEQALRLQQQKQTKQAKALYQQLLSGQVRVSRRLEYLCNKNVATMELEEKSFERALEFFAAALAIDATDVVVWFQMATTAVETGKLWLARRTLEEGLKVDATYWPLVETLAQVLSEIGDVDEYHRVAEYLRRNDPHCATVKVLDGDERKRARPTSRDVKLLRRAQKRVQHLKNIAHEGFKKRKMLQQEINEELRMRMQTKSYEVKQPSWSVLGKVLLEAFEENNRDEHADVMRTKVEIKLGYDEQEVDKEVEVEKELEVSNRETDNKEKSDVDKQPSQGESDHPPPAKRPKHKEVVKVSVAVETSTGISDNDTQDSGILSSEMMEFQPRRRKSRRNEERLREEHAAAVKSEKDLAYGLGALLPDFINKEDREFTPESVSIEWLPPLNVELIDDEFHISNASKEVLAKTTQHNQNVLV